MFIDAQTQLSAAQALTATAASTNIYDLGVDRDVGVGEPLGVYIVATVAADFTTTDETYQIDLQTDDNSGFSSPTVIARRIPVVTASATTSQLAAGSRLVIPIPQDNERYLRLNYTLGGTTPSVTLSAWIAPLSMMEKFQQYASGFTVN